MSEVSQYSGFSGMMAHPLVQLQTVRTHSTLPLHSINARKKARSGAGDSPWTGYAHWIVSAMELLLS